MKIDSLVPGMIAIILSVFVALFLPTIGVLMAAFNSVGRTYDEIKRVYGEPVIERQMAPEELRHWVPRATAECDRLLVYAVSGHTLLLASSSQNVPIYGCYRIPEFPHGRPSFYFVSGASGVAVGILYLLLDLVLRKRSSAKARACTEPRSVS